MNKGGYSPQVQTVRSQPIENKCLSIDWVSPLFFVVSGLCPTFEASNISSKKGYEDIDGNFIEQLQTTGFDTRIWELYLFAALTEMGYTFDRTHNAPDFMCHGLDGTEMCIEAVTVNPTRDAAGAKNKARSTHDHALYLDDRKTLMQWWADYLTEKMAVDVKPQKFLKDE